MEPGTVGSDFAKASYRNVLTEQALHLFILPCLFLLGIAGNLLVIWLLIVQQQKFKNASITFFIVRFFLQIVGLVNFFIFSIESSLKIEDKTTNESISIYEYYCFWPIAVFVSQATVIAMLFISIQRYFFLNFSSFFLNFVCGNK